MRSKLRVVNICRINMVKFHCKCSNIIRPYVLIYLKWVVCLFVWRLGLWCLTPFSTIFQLCLGGQFYWYRNLEDPEKTTDLSQVTDKRHCMMLYTSLWLRFELTTLVMIGTDYICSCKFKYHMITAMTVPYS